MTRFLGDWNTPTFFASLLSINTFTMTRFLGDWNPYIQQHWQWPENIFHNDPIFRGLKLVRLLTFWVPSFTMTRFLGDWNACRLPVCRSISFHNDPIFRGLKLATREPLKKNFMVFHNDPIFRGLKLTFFAIAYPFPSHFHNDPIFRGLKHFWSSNVERINLFHNDPIFRGLKHDTATVDCSSRLSQWPDF